MNRPEPAFLRPNRDEVRRRVKIPSRLFEGEELRSPEGVRWEGGTTSHSACSVRMPVALGNDPLAGVLMEMPPSDEVENPFTTPAPSCRSGPETVSTAEAENPFKTPAPSITSTTTLPSTDDIVRRNRLTEMLSHTRKHAAQRRTSVRSQSSASIRSQGSASVRSRSAPPPNARQQFREELEESDVIARRPYTRDAEGHPPAVAPARPYVQYVESPPIAEYRRRTIEYEANRYQDEDNVVERALRWVFARPPLSWIVWICVEGYWLPIFLVVLGTLTVIGGIDIYRQDYPKQIEEKIARLSPEAGLMRWNPAIHGPWQSYKPPEQGGGGGYKDEDAFPTIYTGKDLPTGTAHGSGGGENGGRLPTGTGGGRLPTGAPSDAENSGRNGHEGAEHVGHVHSPVPMI